jgi:hypothetical protein
MGSSTVGAAVEGIVSLRKEHSMHTILVILGGLVLLGLFLLLGPRLAGLPTADAAKFFIPVWFVAAAFNLWVGVKRAGYSFADEAPIFAIVFAIPAAVGLLVWKLAR